jgi:hypothetical protein
MALKLASAIAVHCDGRPAGNDAPCLCRAFGDHRLICTKVDFSRALLVPAADGVLAVMLSMVNGVFKSIVCTGVCCCATQKYRFSLISSSAAPSFAAWGTSRRSG